MLVRLKHVRKDMLERLIEQSWRRQATKKLLAGDAPERKPRRATRR
jgi:hypothetical protein